MRLLHDIGDLLLARACIGCDLPGPPLCEACSAELMPTPFAVPDLPASLAPAMAAHRYTGLARTAVLAHKEAGVRFLTPALGLSLASTARALASPSGVQALVPVPSHAASVRARGRDTVLEIARNAGARLEVPVLPLLGRAVGARQKARTATERRAQVAGVTMRGRVHHDVALVLVDDVIATGSTAAACVHELRAAGMSVTGVAAIAASVLHGTGRV